MPCSKLGVKRGHCATIPLSLSIAAVEAEYVVAIEAGEATLLRRLLLLLLFLVYEVAQRPWPLFLCSFPAKKGGYMMILMRRTASEAAEADVVLGLSRL